MALKKRAGGVKTAARRKSKAGKAREPERDYSHRKLIDKLGVKVGQQIAVVGVDDAAFLDELSARVPSFYTGVPHAPADLIFYAVEDRSDLPELKTLAALLLKTGAVWAVFPKGQGHIRDTDVIAAAKGAGLVDNKVCKFSETHTALRLCIPVAKR
jgi:hypothetical protein